MYGQVPPVAYEVLIGAACSILLLALGKLALDMPSTPPQRWLAAFLGTSICFLARPLIPAAYVEIHLLLLPITLLPVATFWLFAHALCRENASFPGWGWALIGTNLLLHGAAAVLELQHAGAAPAAVQTMLVSAYAVKIAMIGAALATLVGEYRQDLDDARRSLRRAILIVLGAFMLAIAILLAAHVWVPVSTLSYIAFGCLIWLMAMLVGGYLFGIAPRALVPDLHSVTHASPAQPVDKIADPAQRRLAERLLAHMRAGAYREAGISIAALAGALQTPEHQLRRLINRHLGFRNFNDFVNRYRIEEASALLVASPQRKVLDVALEVGFGSLSPFNVAFKRATGRTPTQFRAEAQGLAPVVDRLSPQ
jgi:AraC-like DNA-binding protein